MRLSDEELINIAFTNEANFYFWQQDGATIHRNLRFMEYLDHQFDGRVLGLGADLRGLRGHSWAPRSPDLSVLDFSIWSIMKRRW